MPISVDGAEQKRELCFVYPSKMIESYAMQNGSDAPCKCQLGLYIAS